MRLIRLTPLAPIIALALGAAACGGSSSPSTAAGGSSSAPTTGGASSEPASGATTTIAGEQANNHGTKAVEDHGSTEVELDDDYFEPTVLTGQPGQKVTLELKNEGKKGHTFTIAGQHIDKVLAPDSSGTVTVTMPRSGTLAFVCRFHEKLGMVGELKVGA